MKTVKPIIVDGKKISLRILTEIKKNAAKLKSKPGLAVVLVGNNSASKSYVKHKEKAAKEVGFNFAKYLFPEKTTENKIIDLIKKLNKDQKINAILIQLPLPKHLNREKIIKTLDPKKDVDGMHPKNLKKLAQGEKVIFSPTAQAVIEILKNKKINLKNKKIAIIGRSIVIGQPLYLYLKNKGYWVNQYHSQTKNIKTKTKKVDILISATGQAKMINDSYLKNGVIAIDVGFKKIGKKIYGDFDFESTAKKASLISPVPGGVGPITIAFLLKNTLELAKK